MMKKWVFILSVLAIVFGLSGYYLVFVQPAFSGPSEEKFDLIIHHDAPVAEIKDSLVVNQLRRPSLFMLLSQRMNYRDDNLKSGLFEIDKQWNIVELIRYLRSGEQKPVSITFNSVRTIPDLAGKITDKIELDSIVFLEYLDTLSDDPQQLMVHYIPNTYQVYYNISAEELHQRMLQESKRFWAKNERQEKASEQGLTQQEVYALASIVEQESTIEAEKPTIASVYLNRIKRGMKLQADPTVVYASGDFTLRRVLNKHLEIDSPYNTYKYAGIPPGPICMPSISSIEAVLNPTNTNYIFFCAKPGYQNGHAFASTLQGHNRNAKRYQRWLTIEGIK